MTPAFHFNILRDFCDVFAKNSGRLIKNLKEVTNEEINIIPYITNFALNSICGKLIFISLVSFKRLMKVTLKFLFSLYNNLLTFYQNSKVKNDNFTETAMGTDLETVHEKQKKNYKTAIFEMGHHAVHRLTRAWLHPAILFWLSPLGQRQGKTLSVLHDFSTNVIRKRRNERLVDLKKTHDEKINYDYHLKSTKKRTAMLDLLLTAEEDGMINEEGIREEVDTFMFEVSYFELHIVL